MASFVLGYTYLATIIVAIAFIFTIRPPKSVTIDKPLSPSKVSIIVPARNEERNIGKCIEGLKEQNYEDYEIIVVDGHSTDRTVEIVQSYDVKVVSEPEKPMDWVGKPWACYQGYKEATGDILLFTDADTYHAPDALNTTIAHLEKSGGFLSLLTTQEFKTFWEHLLSIVFLIISVSVRGTSGTKNSRIANGQYLMFTQERYEMLGTHQIVKGSIIEDLEFGSIATQKGYPPQIIFVRNLVTARMYQSLTEIREGFGKNLALGVNYVGIESILYSGIVTIWGMGWVIVLPVYLVFQEYITWAVMLSLFAYLTFFIMLMILEANLSTEATLYPLIYPFFFVVFWVLVLQSMYQTWIRKEIVWKDRSYSV